MTFDRTRFGRGVAALTVFIGLGGVVAQLVLGTVGLFSEGNFALNFAVAAVGFGAVAWIVLPSQPNNGMVWALTWAAFISAVAVVGTVLLASFAPTGVTSTKRLFAYSPSELAPGAAFGAMLAGGTWVAAVFLPLGVGLPLFPDGRPLGPRWKWLVRVNVTLIGAITLGLTLASNPNSTTPIETSGEDFDGLAGAIVEWLFFPMVVGVVLAIISLIVRYRRSSGAARPQIQWIGLGGLAFFVGAITASPNAFPWTLLVGEILLIGAFFIAITKYRLYDINVVVSRAVTFVSLAFVLAVTYGTSVFAYITLVAREAELSSGDLGIALPVGATLLVAIIFEPLRRRLRRWADRLVYGKRAAPHEVLSQLTGQLADTASDSALETLAQLLAEGTAADEAHVWLRVGDRLRAAAAFPSDAVLPTDRALQKEVISEELHLAVPVRRGDEVLGGLSIEKSAVHVVTPADESLLTDVAASAGLLLHNMRLTAELEERARQLRNSRRRLIAAHDEVRHRLERDLHDGAQQQVVALKVKLGLARTIAQREGATDVAALLEGLATDADGAVDGMRQVARGIYPPLLEAEGLDTALRAWARTAADDVELSIDIQHRHPRPVEETIYFTAIHAIGAAMSAGAETLRVDVVERTGAIDIAIRHDAPYSFDITPLVDRVDAHDGQLHSDDHDLSVTLPAKTVAEVVLT